MKDVNVTTINTSIIAQAMNEIVTITPSQDDEGVNYTMNVIMECISEIDGIRDRRYTQFYFSPLAYRVMFEAMRELVTKPEFEKNLDSYVAYLKTKEVKEGCAE